MRAAKPRVDRRRFLVGSLATFGAGVVGLGCGDGDGDEGELGQCRSRCAEVGPELIVAPEDLAGELDDPDLQLLDLRGPGAGPALPGALPLAITELLRTVDGVEGMVADPSTVEAALRAAGVRAGARLVAYADGGQLAAARCLWTLGLHDHFDVRLLDGGFLAWANAGLPTAELAAAPEPGDWSAGALVEALRVDADWILDRLDDPELALVDARSPTEFGDGHIPGAQNVEWRANLDGEDRILPAATVESLYELGEASTVVSYCRTGMRASMAWLALRWLGRVDVRLYDGSWEDWSRDPARPIDTA